MILGVIPARGGSKGIPGKNLQPLQGRPLIWYSIHHAHTSKLLDRFVVSTEDARIAEVARDCAAEVLPRPVKLAKDNSTTISVLKHVATELPEYDTIVLLQPTSPIRYPGLIDECITTFEEQGCDSLATGFISYQYEWGTMKNIPRQKMKGFFYDDGNVYVHKAENVRKGQRYGANRYAMEIPRKYNLEIDDEVDLLVAEAILAGC